LKLETRNLKLKPMRIPRIHHPDALSPGATVTLEGEPANHVARVLRLGPGDAVTLFDGHGGEYAATIEAVEKRSVTVVVGAFRDVDVESPLRITLVQGISKGERMDFTVQKAVEMGVHRIVPVFTARTVVKLQGERLERRRRHWQGVAASACGQCGRNRIPEVAAPVGLDAWLTEPADGLRLLLHHEAEATVANLPPPDEGVTLLIGPEGGLNEAERRVALDAGFRGLRLGPRVLRTETAALAALAGLQSHWGDLR